MNDNHILCDSINHRRPYKHDLRNYTDDTVLLNPLELRFIEKYWHAYE